MDPKITFHDLNINLHQKCILAHKLKAWYLPNLDSPLIVTFKLDIRNCTYYAQLLECFENVSFASCWYALLRSFSAGTMKREETCVKGEFPPAHLNAHKLLGFSVNALKDCHEAY